MDLARNYHAKLLLFGEYTILQGGEALAFPLEQYSAQWNKTAIDDSLLGFFDYLKKFEFLERRKIEKIMKDGIEFKSNIPRGYGLGSSAALTAAAYQAFCNTPSNDIQTLKSDLALIENYFHGNSSGFDPLCAYLDKAIHFKSGEIDILEKMPKLSRWFLIDSGQERDSKAMIKIFMEKKKDKDFVSTLSDLESFNQCAIKAVIEEDKEALEETLKRISVIQLEHFAEMITNDIRSIWKKGLDSGKYSLKLSGAGGGGTYVGFGEIEEKNITYIS